MSDSIQQTQASGPDLAHGRFLLGPRDLAKNIQFSTFERVESAASWEGCNLYAL